MSIVMRIRTRSDEMMMLLMMRMLMLSSCGRDDAGMHV